MMLPSQIIPQPENAACDCAQNQPAMSTWTIENLIIFNNYAEHTQLDKKRLLNLLFVLLLFFIRIRFLQEWLNSMQATYKLQDKTYMKKSELRFSTSFSYKDPNFSIFINQLLISELFHREQNSYSFMNFKNQAQKGLWFRFQIRNIINRQTE